MYLREWYYHARRWGECRSTNVCHHCNWPLRFSYQYKTNSWWQYQTTGVRVPIVPTVLSLSKAGRQYSARRKILRITKSDTNLSLLIHVINKLLYFSELRLTIWQNSIQNRRWTRIRNTCNKVMGQLVLKIDFKYYKRPRFYDHCVLFGETARLPENTTSSYKIRFEGFFSAMVSAHFTNHLYHNTIHTTRVFVDNLTAFQ